ncbi:MAG: RNB domain-containing ribonuclease, partial [Bowdeniella nasicola]|nr:RNB domain-containing ribonuclease [Bowdeniella nasicola]
MPRRRLVLTADSADIDNALAQLRAQLDIRDHYPPAALTEATKAANTPLPAPGEVGSGTPPRPAVPILDARDVPLVTVDPETSRDLDQAAALERIPGGYRLHYAIACLAFFVDPKAELDQETHRRATTVYGPGHAIGLHPDVIAAGAGSLLPAVDRLAYLWRIDISEEGTILDADVAPALVRSRAQLSYTQVQAALDARAPAAPLGAIAAHAPSSAPQPLPAQVPADFAELLAAFGRARLSAERARGGISLDIPEQRIVPAATGYALAYRSNVPVESYNAQLSLTCGIAAAQMMR